MKALPNKVVVVVVVSTAAASLDRWIAVDEGLFFFPLHPVLLLLLLLNTQQHMATNTMSSMVAIVRKGAGCAQAIRGRTLIWGDDKGKICSSLYTIELFFFFYFPFSRALIIIIVLLLFFMFMMMMIAFRLLS